MSTTVIDPAKVEEFAGQLGSVFVGSMLTYMIEIGARTGLFTAAAQGPATSGELADRSGLTERYVREWLGAMVTGDIFDYEPKGKVYSLPAARAACLTPGPANMAGIAGLSTHLAKHVHQVERAFREGGGVPYAEYRPEFTDVMDALGRDWFDGFLVDAFVSSVPGLVDRLRTGVRVADVGCGTGHALVLLGREFPASTFVGYDFNEGAIARARAEASGAGLSNVRFEVCDVARLTVDQPFDVVFVFDAIHDQVDPAAVLANIHAAIVDGGTFVMAEPRAADNLEDNLDNPLAPILYTTSTLHCMTVSLAHDGAGIGAVFGEGLARQMLTDAGFENTVVLDAPGDPINAVYVTHKPS